MSKISITALAVAVLFSLPAVAGDARSLNFTPRQMAHCVMHRVKDSPSESYKNAYRACKDQFDASAANDKENQTAMNNADAAAAK
jgi:hypothetical protein